MEVAQHNLLIVRVVQHTSHDPPGLLLGVRCPWTASAAGQPKQMLHAPAHGCCPPWPSSRSASRLAAAVKSIRTGRGGGLWEKMFHLFHLHRDEFRGNVETTFSRIKAKFRGHVRSRHETLRKTRR